MELLFSCAGIEIELKGDLPEYVSPDVKAYFKKNNHDGGQNKLSCFIKRCDELNSVEGIPIFHDPFRLVLNNKDKEQRIFLATEYGNPYACLKEREPAFYEIDYLGKYLPVINMRFVELLPLEKILLEKDGFILHACFIKYQGKGILFTAPSGTGKSTQGNLWVKSEGAKIINGDRCIIRKISGKYYACGLPFCGSSSININEMVPLRAIVIVEQAPTNKAETIEKAEAVKKLLSETSVNYWNSQFVDNIINLIEDVAQNIDIFRLKCTISKEAVDVLKEKIS